ALDRITLKNVHDARQFAVRVADEHTHEFGLTESRWLQPPYSNRPELWEIDEPAATTSYLVSLEYKARVSIAELNRAYCDYVVNRRAALMCVALAAYRLDHQNYPAHLADLVPEYLKELPLDPYSSQPFVYQPVGLNLPLDCWMPGSETNRIEAHRPLFWSVGPAN